MCLPCLFAFRKVKEMSNLQEAITHNNAAYAKWIAYGKPEAFTELNDSNRELIRAYLQDHPSARGYKYYYGVIDLQSNPLNNFCCDYVFDLGSRIVVSIDPKKAERIFTPQNHGNQFLKIYAVCFVILRSKATKNLYIYADFVIKFLRLRSG